MSEQTSSTWKIANFAVGLVSAVLVWGALDGGDRVSVFSLELQAWILVLVAYLLGAAAMWLAKKSSGSASTP